MTYQEYLHNQLSYKKCFETVALDRTIARLHRQKTEESRAVVQRDLDFLLADFEKKIKN